MKSNRTIRTNCKHNGENVANRIVKRWVESRLRSTQYGFRPKRSTTQALAVARRALDAAHAARGQGIIALLLDWVKAFDRLKVDTMLHALGRFGLSAAYLQIIGSIYKARYLQ